MKRNILVGIVAFLIIIFLIFLSNQKDNLL